MKEGRRSLSHVGGPVTLSGDPEAAELLEVAVGDIVQIVGR